VTCSCSSAGSAEWNDRRQLSVRQRRTGRSPCWGAGLQVEAVVRPVRAIECQPGPDAIRTVSNSARTQEQHAVHRQAEPADRRSKPACPRRRRVWAAGRRRDPSCRSSSRPGSRRQADSGTPRSRAGRSLAPTVGYWGPGVDVPDGERSDGRGLERQPVAAAIQSAGL
jgi:hypothetical protein